LIVQKPESTRASRQSATLDEEKTMHFDPMAFNPSVLIVLPLLFLTPLAILLVVLHHRRAIAALKQKTVLELLERGAAVPPELLSDASMTTRDGDLRRGLVLSLTGVGAIVFVLTLPRHDAWGLGLLPLFAGLGYLITWLLEKRNGSANDRV
jgi:hypothetical protein